jgi:hypothetical protein
LIVLLLFGGGPLGLPEGATAEEPQRQPRITAVTVDPPAVTLLGPQAEFRLLVDGTTGDGRVVDMTGVAQFRSLAPQIADVSPQGVVRAIADGQGPVQVSAAGYTAVVEVTVAGSSGPREFNFERDVVPILSRFGCNSAACHGKAEGQNGFKLSVFGFDPRADYDAIIKEARGRRVSLASPDQSLLLRKAAGLQPHGGGFRIPIGSAHFETLRGWIAAGVPVGRAEDPQVVSIQLVPARRLLELGGQQRLRVVASDSRGRQFDVTPLARFQSNNEGLATVDESGLVTAGQSPGQAAIMASYAGATAVFRALIPRPHQPGSQAAMAPAAPVNFIDELVLKNLQELNLVPSESCDDATFLRRASLDIIGMLPTVDQARQFLADTRRDKRARLVDELLARPEYADYWAMRWADVLRVDRQKLGAKQAYAYYAWIRDGLANNKPLDQMAREILLAEGPLTEAPQAAFYLVHGRPGDTASMFSQVFLGVRIACAECHHHPFDRWSQDDYLGMAGLFAQVGLKKTPRGDVLQTAGEPQLTHPRTGQVVPPHALGQSPPAALPAGDRRQRVADWLLHKDNPWFAKSLVNRTWAHFLGRGLIEPVDDIRDTNPPTNEALLTALAADFAGAGYDLHHLIRTITASQTYQRSSAPNDTNLRDEQNYSRALLKRLPAEVLLDNVCQVTGVPEKFDGVPAGYRAVQLWDSRVPHYFLRLFGRPVRETACECERSSEASVAQVLHLLNSPEIEAKIAHRGGRIARWARETSDDGQLVEELYLLFYSRYPNQGERAAGVAHMAKLPAHRQQAAEDLAWSLLNSLEFVFNH